MSVGKASRNERDDERFRAENGDKKLFWTSSRWTVGGRGARHPEAAGMTAEVAGAAGAQVASRWRPRL